MPTMLRMSGMARMPTAFSASPLSPTKEGVQSRLDHYVESLSLSLAREVYVALHTSKFAYLEREEYYCDNHRESVG